MENSKEVANSYNFFEIQKSHVFFWGMDINPKKVKIKKKIKKLINKFNFNRDEVIEIFDYDTDRFFQIVYKIK